MSIVHTDAHTQKLYDRGLPLPEERRTPAYPGEAIWWMAPTRDGKSRELREGTVVVHRRWYEGDHRIGALLMECRDADRIVDGKPALWACPVSSPHWGFCSRPVPVGDLDGIAGMLSATGKVVNMDELRKTFGHGG